MLELVANKKNILTLSGVLAHQPYFNNSKSGKPYATFMLAQAFKKNNDTKVRYFKVMAFDNGVVEAIKSLSHQAIVEVEGHVSLSSFKNNLTMMIVADKINVVVKFNLPFKSKGGVNIEVYKVANIKSPIVASFNSSEFELELQRLEDGAKHLK